mgnify:CR=1 FL=1
MNLKNLGVICVGLGIGFFLVELLFRILGISYPAFYQPNPLTGVFLRPGVEGKSRIEGRNIIKINSAGLRDREHSKIKPENTFRIVILGDSQAEAMGVTLENTFWAIMEKKLNNWPEKEL